MRDFRKLERLAFKEAGLPFEPLKEEAAEIGTRDTNYIPDEHFEKLKFPSGDVIKWLDKHYPKLEPPKKEDKRKFNTFRGRWYKEPAPFREPVIEEVLETDAIQQDRGI